MERRLVLQCHLLCHSNSEHLRQLYTGFAVLHRQRKIRLSQTIAARKIGYGNDSPHLSDAQHAHLSAIVNGDRYLHFDTHDAKEVALEELARCDVYFKRSYSSAVVAELPHSLRSKVRPLGLNYCLVPDFFDRRWLMRSFRLARGVRAKVGAIKKAFNANNRFEFQPNVSVMSAAPDYHKMPRVLFMVAAYDPYNDPKRSKEKSEEREFNNELRAQCIRLLRAQLGDRTLAGFADSPYARRRYPELVFPGERTSQQQYLNTLRDYPICIATTGLHGSIGWKFAEYIAFSKAIVCEKLLYEVPGPLAKGHHYLEFATPYECVSHSMLLMEQPELRHELMKNNSAYFDAYLRPDALIMNAMKAALSHTNRELSVEPVQATA